MLKEQDFQNILHSSSKKSRSAAIVEIASALSESHHHTDLYQYRIKQNKLYSPTHKVFVEDSTNNPSDKIFIEKLQSWAVDNQQGMALWISPPIYSKEEDAKIVIHNLNSGHNFKVLSIQSIPISLSPADIENLANELYTYSIDPLKQVTTLEILREDLIILKDINEAKTILVNYTNPNALKEYKTHISNAINTYTQRNLNLSLKTIYESAGNYNLTCDTVGIQFPHSKMTLSTEGGRILHCTCPFCKHEVNATIFLGKIYCPNCGKSADYNC